MNTTRNQDFSSLNIFNESQLIVGRIEVKSLRFGWDLCAIMLFMFPFCFMELRIKDLVAIWDTFFNECLTVSSI